MTSVSRPENFSVLTNSLFLYIEHDKAELGAAEEQIGFDEARQRGS